MKIKDYLSSELGEYQQWHGWITLMEGGWRKLPIRIEFNLEDENINNPDEMKFKDCLGDISQTWKKYIIFLIGQF